MLCSPHVERLSVAVDDLPDRTMRHFPSTRLRVRPFQRNGLTVGAGRAFHHEDPGPHRIYPGIHPGRHIFLARDSEGQA